MGKTAIGMLVLALAAGVATAEAPPPRYAPANVFGTGYTDEEVAPGEWKVRGASAQPGAGHAIALYRAAELAQAAGVREIRIVRQNVSVLIETNRYSGASRTTRELARLTVRAVRDDADRIACEEKQPSHCLTLPVVQILAQFGPELGQSAGPHPEAVALLPRITTGAPADFAGRPIPQPFAAPIPTTAGAALRTAMVGRLGALWAPSSAPTPPAPAAPAMVARLDTAAMPAPRAAAPAPAMPVATPPLDPYAAGRLAGAAARAAAQPQGD